MNPCYNIFSATERDDLTMKINLHTHTPRCNHAVGTEREYIERAIQAGIKTLGFADHSPMPFEPGYYSTYRIRLDEYENYIETLCALKEEYKKDVNLLIGFEAEYYPAYFDRLIDMLRPYPIDYLIMGQHFLNNETDSAHVGRPTDDEEYLSRYVDQTAEGLKTGRFTYFAHPDVVNFIGDDEVYRRHMTRLCENAKALDIPLEINMLGVWDKRNYPCDRFFRIAGEVGNKVVLGIDAHQPERILEQDVLADARALAERCGVTISDDITIRNPLF